MSSVLQWPLSCPLKQNMGGYYIACQTCQKKVLPADMDSLKEEFPEKEFPVQLWKCQKCDEDVENVLPVFMLTIRVMDCTGETKFLLFDKLAMEVVNQTAAELVEHYGEIQDPDFLPLALSNICGKTYLFKVSIEKCNTIYHSDTFKVIKIVTQSDIVKEFTETSVSQEKTPLAIKKIGLSAEGSKEIPLMILDSPCDERTPSSKRKSDDVDETEVKTEYSSVKKPCLDDAVIQENVKIELKPVKVEKTHDDLGAPK